MSPPRKSSLVPPAGVVVAGPGQHGVVAGAPDAGVGLCRRECGGANGPGQGVTLCLAPKDPAWQLGRRDNPVGRDHVGQPTGATRRAEGAKRCRSPPRDPPPRRGGSERRRKRRFRSHHGASAAAVGPPGTRPRVGTEARPPGVRAMARLDRVSGPYQPPQAAPRPAPALVELGHLPRSRPSVVRWRPSAPIWIDVVAFTDALGRGDPAAAVRHYGGALLPACYDDWVLAEPERLRTLAVDALAQLAATAYDERRDDDVVDHARHLLRIDPSMSPRTACSCVPWPVVANGVSPSAPTTAASRCSSTSSVSGPTPRPSRLTTTCAPP